MGMSDEDFYELMKSEFDPKYHKVIKDIIFTNLSMAKIGAKYNIKGNTLTYIQRGQRRKELTKDFLVPLRQFQKENQEIYLNKKGGSSL